MRSLFTSLFDRETGSASSEAQRGRPETLRRKTLAANSRIIIATSVIGTPAALYLLTKGALMPFVIVTIGLCAGFMTLALHRRGQYERAAFGQVYATLLVGLVLTLWMFLTPIVYPASLVPARFRWVLDINPMTAIVGAYRAALLDDRMPAPVPFALFAVIALVLFVSGHWLFMRTKPTFADLL